MRCKLDNICKSLCPEPGTYKVLDERHCLSEWEGQGSSNGSEDTKLQSTTNHRVPLGEASLSCSLVKLLSHQEAV